MSRKPSDAAALSAQIHEDAGREFSIFRLACKSVFTHVWMNAKMCFTFACLAFLICLFTVYNAALNERRLEAFHNTMSANYAYSDTTDLSDVVRESGADLVFTSWTKKHRFSEDVRRATGVLMTDPSTDLFMLEIDGTTHQAVSSVPFTCYAMWEGSMFSENDSTELEAVYGYTSLLSAGSIPQERNEFIVSELILDAYELTAEDVLGKEISAYIPNVSAPEEGDIHEFTARCTGVVRREYYQLTGHSGSSDILALLMFSKDSDLFAKNNFNRYFYHFGDWPDSDLLQEWTKLGIKHVNHAVLTDMHALDDIQVLASNLYIIVGSALVIGLILTVFLMIDKYMKIFSRSGGILLTFGMERRQLYSLLLLQLLILCAFAIPISLALTAAGYGVINFVISWATRVDLSLSSWQIVSMLGIGIGVVVGISLLFFAYAVFMLRKHTIKQFLSAEVD